MEQCPWGHTYSKQREADKTQLRHVSSPGLNVAFKYALLKCKYSWKWDGSHLFIYSLTGFSLILDKRKEKTVFSQTCR